MQVINKSNNILIADKVRIANNPISRLVGLLNKKELKSGEGILLVPCNNIHSFGMKFNFDAVFLDKNNKVVHLIQNMPKSKISPMIFSAHKTLEIQACSIDEKNIKVGDVLEFIE